MKNTFAFITMVLFVVVNLFNINFSKEKNFFYITVVFCFSMICMTLSQTPITFFIFWELLSVCSYFLIVKTDKKAALNGFLFTLFGGIFLISGLIITPDILNSTNTDEIVNILPFESIFQQITNVVDRYSINIITQIKYNNYNYNFTISEILIAIGILIKSAQFIFSSWLVKSMKAIPQVSAYLHSATLIKAGVFLTLKITNKMNLFNDLILISLMFTLIINFYNLYQSEDLKKSLAYFTITSIAIALAYCVIGCKHSLDKEALSYIFWHAFYKSSLFLSLAIIEKQCKTKKFNELKNAIFSAPIASSVFIVALFMSIFSPGYKILNAEIQNHTNILTYYSVFFIKFSKFFTLIYSVYIIQKCFIPPISSINKNNFHFDKSSIMLFIPIAIPFFFIDLHISYYTYLIIFITFNVIFLLNKINLHSKIIKYFIILTCYILTIFCIYIIILHFSTVKTQHHTVFDTLIFVTFSLFLFAFLILLLSSVQNFTLTSIKKHYSKINLLHTNFVQRHFIHKIIFYFLVTAIITILMNYTCIDYLSEILSNINITSNIMNKCAILISNINFNIQSFIVISFVFTIYGSYLILKTKSSFNYLLGLNLIGVSVGLIYIFTGAIDVAIVHFLTEIIGTVVLYKILSANNTMKNINSYNLQITNENTYDKFLNIFSKFTSVFFAIFIFILFALIHNAPMNFDMIHHFSNITIHSDNIVNMIVTDYRGFDTWGEMTVICIVTLIIIYICKNMNLYKSNNNKNLKNILIKSIQDTYPNNTHDMIIKNINFNQKKIIPSKSRDIFISKISNILILIMSIYGIITLFQGHNIPGGGFVTGLIFSILIINLKYIIKFNALKTIIICLLISSFIIILPVIFGFDFFTNLSINYFSLALFFDFCICIAVINMISVTEI